MAGLVATPQKYKCGEMILTEPDVPHEVVPIYLQS